MCFSFCCQRGLLCDKQLVLAVLAPLEGAGVLMAAACMLHVDCAWACSLHLQCMPPGADYLDPTPAGVAAVAV